MTATGLLRLRPNAAILHNDFGFVVEGQFRESMGTHGGLLCLKRERPHSGDEGKEKTLSGDVAVGPQSTSPGGVG
jgi:hypothetical protein